MDKKINTLYFSATNTTKKVVSGIANKLSENMKSEITNNIDFTLPKVRENSVAFTEEDIVIVGVPVYAGRVPNVLLKYLNSIEGNGALAVAVVLYGNRNYDDALIELKDILEDRGFNVISAGAFIGEHSFSKILAQNRPDDKDMAIVEEFADKIYNKLSKGDKLYPIEVKGCKPYRNYYRPKNKEGIPVDIRKVKPKTNSNCNDCKICARVCPMGSIDFEDVTRFNGICIKCGACIKKCPNNAKYYDDENYLRHKHELEDELTYRREPELFI
ncbi:NADH-plastoquinone oxidoreductase subunit [Clostridium acetireducens DSM 10703]|uniref:NADH-plastoquinone oxidoreductase subunit n=1 Tax=Clostridium acetireducens DSM 10703 TaxID=1121290 RepID=A0A1E8EVV1_9CLOT|nr:EFR1 family ferrodoxin [Clostridium acetireducens]OFI01379.1 NADH-plastoquinone oxidoreductase subunit [Clostridium acetireducens DSM 10703]